MKEIDDRTRSSIEEVTSILERGNFQTVKNEFGEANLKKLLLKLHPKYTMEEIEEITGIPDSTLSRWFSKLGIDPQKRWHNILASKAGSRNSTKLKRSKGTISKVATVKITPELAYVIGFTLGDGAVQKYMVEVFNKNEGLRLPLYNYLKPYGTITEDRRDYGLWRLRLSSVKIANLIKTNKKPNRETIDYVLKKDKLARKFVAAFWDAEGSVRKEKQYTHVYLYNSDIYLLEKIGEYLNKKNIDYSTLFTFRPNREYYLKGRKIKAKKKIYRISIPKSSLKKWAKEIGIHMIHTKKKKVVEEILNYKMGDKI